MKNNCKISECKRNVHGKGLCSKHYQKLRKYGDANHSVYYRDPEAAFSAYAKHEGDCLVWAAGKDKDGYGKMTVAGKSVLAHRYAWERANGTIPDEATVDHKCWNKSCVNAEHLRLAVAGQNHWYQSGAQRDSSTGVRNVYRHNSGYRVLIGKGGVQRNYGHFKSLDEAAEYAANMRAELFGEFAGRG